MIKKENGTELTSVDIVFDVPNFKNIRNQRHKRDVKLLKQIDYIAGDDSEKFHKAATLIQKTVRGFLGRKQYLSVLYELVKEGEEKLHLQEIEQVAEGEILIENYKMEQELLDADDVSRNKKRNKNKSAKLIQRAWRQYHRKMKEHICCSCQDDYPNLYEYYNETQEICFCCDYHKLNKVDDEYDVIENDVLPYPTTDWLHVESLLLDNNNDMELSNNNIKSHLSVQQDVKLTFVESYESTLNDLEITYDNVEVSDIIENVIDLVANNKLEPTEESQRVLKSLKIHEEHEKKIKLQSSISFDELFSKSNTQLRNLIEDLQKSIGEKNLELVLELTTRDELNSQHEALLMEADDLQDRKSQNKIQL